ncbi:MAG TPA: TIGR02391 family protein [Clostridiaceae bacterium]
MELKLGITQDLWEAIEKNYENESYSSCILDGIHLLTDTIRNKTGLEGDGSSLVGQAFGGDNPKIQLNKLQTDSEKNIQRGIQDILKGFYSAIRNPRSHDKAMDTKQEADTIILFVDYLLKLIDKSKISFEEEIYLGRVFDKHYVKTEEYSNLLVDEIPKRKRVDIAIAIIKRRKEGNILCLGYFMSALLPKLEENELVRAFKVVSEELKYTDSAELIRTMLHICSGKYWDRVDKAVKIRIEHIIKEDVRLGTYNKASKKCGEHGALATWITDDLLLKFENRSEWNDIIIQKLRTKDEVEVDYVESFFWAKTCKWNYDDIEFNLEHYIRYGLKAKDEAIVLKLKLQIMWTEDHPWWQIFKEELKEYPEIKYDDSLPF